jgi:hypothetical protein
MGFAPSSGESRLVTDAIAMNPDNRIIPPAAGSHNLRRRGVLGGAEASVRCPATLFSRCDDGPHRSSPFIAGSRLPRAPSSRPARPILPRLRPLPQSNTYGDASGRCDRAIDRRRPSSPCEDSATRLHSCGPPAHASDLHILNRVEVKGARRVECGHGARATRCGTFNERHSAACSACSLPLAS